MSDSILHTEFQDRTYTAPDTERKIVEYECFWANNEDTLNEKITKLILKGFQPFGGVSITVCYDTEVNFTCERLVQAMVKYE